MDNPIKNVKRKTHAYLDKNVNVECVDGGFVLHFQDPWCNVNRTIPYKHRKSLVKYVTSNVVGSLTRGKEWQREYDRAYKIATRPGARLCHADHPAMLAYTARWTAITKEISAECKQYVDAKMPVA